MRELSPHPADSPGKQAFCAAQEPGPGEPPRIAAVVPTLDEATRLPALLDSLGWRASGRERGEHVPEIVVVSDGGSRDATVPAARARGVNVVSAPTGRGAQLAAGARAASCEPGLGPRDVLLFLHADTRVAPGAIAAVRAAFRRAHLDAAGLRQRIDAAGWFYRAVERAANRRVARGWVYGDSGLAVRRATYDAVGGFLDLPIFEDLDLSRRLRERGRVEWIGSAELVISARRWRAEGPLRRTLCNRVLTVLWRFGVSPARLARFYRAAAAPRATPDEIELRHGGAA